MRKSEPGTQATSVDEYLSRVPEEMRVVLGRLRRTIRTAAPQAEELISYRIPAYHQNGMLVFFAAFKSHCSLFVASKAVVKRFNDELKGFHAAGATIHFTPEKPLPEDVVKKLVKAKLEENQTRAKAKTSSRNPKPKATAVSRSTQSR